jgi:hypothetical protein
VGIEPDELRLPTDESEEAFEGRLMADALAVLKQGAKPTLQARL